MANVTNLNRFRKQQARDAKRKQADENAARHGLSRAEKTLAEARNAKARRDLDGHKTDTPER